MKKTEEMFNISKKWDNYYEQFKCILFEEKMFFKCQFDKLKFLGKFILYLQIIIFIWGLFSSILGIGNLINKTIFYTKGIKYYMNCNDLLFEIHNEDTCSKYADTKLGKILIKKREYKNKEDIVINSVYHYIKIENVLKQSPQFDKSSYKIKEDMGYAIHFQLLNNTLKDYSPYENRLTLDGYMKIHTIGKSLDEKNIIFSVYPYCEGETYNQTFSCPRQENYNDLPITIKTIYCENGEIVKDIFDDC